MIKDKKIFTGGLNTDDDPRLMDPKDYLNMENCRMTISEFSKDGRVEFFPGTNLVFSGSGKTIGGGIDYDNRRLLFCNYESGASKMYCFDADSGNTYKILDEADYPINWNPQYNVFIRVVSGIAYFTDNYNEPRKLNIESAIKAYNPSFTTTQTAYTLPIDYSVLTIARKSFSTCPVIEKISDVTYDNNFIADMSVRFFVRLTYRDGEVSVLSPGSKLSNYNYATQAFNYIKVTLPSEQIEQDVQIVELVIRVSESNTFNVIKTWDKRDSGELAEIDAHNLGTPLTFDYYGDLLGYSIAEQEAFDSVPLKALGIERARDRMFLANYLTGYDTPQKSSLTTSIVEVSSGSTLTIEWIDFRIDRYADPSFTTYIGTYEYWVAKINGHDPLYYYFSTVPFPAVPPLTITLASATRWNNDLIGLANSIYGADGTFKRYTSVATSYTSTVTDVSATTADSNTFKSNGYYRFGVVFYDRYRRRCGVVEASKLHTAPRTYGQTIYNKGINWTLSNTDALTEIPDWAYYYHIVRTQNLVATNFLQARAADVTYVKKNNDNTYTYTDTYANDNYGIAVDISKLAGFGMGYTFKDNDLMVLYVNPSTHYTLRILGQDGPYVHVALQDIGSGSAVQALFEIYTPYKQSENEFFFEIGESYPVVNPGTNTREYSIVSGTLSGDVYLIQRETSSPYLVEAMSPSDKFWNNWFTDCYGPNLITKLGQVRKDNFIRWSDTIIQGTQINGLSTYKTLNEKHLPIEAGSIQGLQLTTKIQEDGTVMLAIGNNEALSLYLGERTMNTQEGIAAVITSDEVIGAINNLRGRSGTLNPESIHEYNGVVWWFDARNGAIQQYSVNGIDDLSLNKLSSFWRRYGRRYLEQGKTAIETLAGTSNVILAIDPVSKELLVSIPQVEVNGFCGQLAGYSTTPSYTASIDNRYDFYDGKSKTVGFDTISNRWKYSLGFISDFMESIGNNLYAFRDGSMYRLNADMSNRNKFFDITQPARICLASTLDPSTPRIARSISIEATKAPEFTHVYSSYPNVQATDLIKEDYKKREGVFYSNIKRDRLSPNVTGTEIDKMNYGDPIKGVVPYVMVEFSTPDQDLKLNFVNIGARQSSGHNL